MFEKIKKKTEVQIVFIYFYRKFIYKNFIHSDFGFLHFYNFVSH